MFKIGDLDSVGALWGESSNAVLCVDQVERLKIGVDAGQFQRLDQITQLLSGRDV